MSKFRSRATLLGGPLDGYHHELAVVDWELPLRFNSVVEPGHRQHVYHHTGKDVSTGEPVYEYQGDDVSVPLRLDDPGVDVPAHAFRRPHSD